MCEQLLTWTLEKRLQSINNAPRNFWPKKFYLRSYTSTSTYNINLHFLINLPKNMENLRQKVQSIAKFNTGTIYSIAKFGHFNLQKRSLQHYSSPNCPYISYFPSNKHHLIMSNSYIPQSKWLKTALNDVFPYWKIELFTSVIAMLKSYLVIENMNI